MKKNYIQSLIVAIALFSGLQLFAQTIVTIPSGNPAGTGSTVSPHRKPYGTARSYERSAMKYTQAELGVLGTITDIAFYCDSLTTPGNSIVKIYLKNVADSTFTASTVATEETGATLVYSDTIFSSSFALNTWINVTLTTPFAHNNNANLEVIIETNSGGLIGTDSTTHYKGFRYTSFTPNRFEYWQSPNNNGTIPINNGTLSAFRPNVQFTITPLALCTAPPNAGTLAASALAVCTGANVNLTLTGTSTGTGITYQWLSSPDNITWSAVSGAVQNTYTSAITDTIYYACEVTCSGSSDTTNVVGITLNPFYNCYCTAAIGGNCAVNAIDSVAIVGTTLNNPHTGCSTGNYISYPATGSTTASLVQGQSYSFVTRYTGNERVSLWIDYNHDGLFNNNEWTQLCITSTAGTDVISNVTLPITALTGTTGMRIRSRATAGVNDSTTACAAFGTGETEDYVIDITAAPLCTSPPTAGTAVASSYSVCAGNSVNFSLTGNNGGIGMTYQWYSSADSINWILESGATLSTYSAVINSPLFYSCVLTCSGLSDTSGAAYVVTNPFYLCYCNTGLGGNCVANAIDSVAITGTTLANGLTGCSAGNHIVYPASGNTTATLTQGQTYTFVTKYIGNERASVWIDYNQNGTFNTSEWHQLCITSVTGTAVNTTVTIPMTAGIGLTGMRIRSRGNTGLNDSTAACTLFNTGETEDYIINIVAAPPCTTPPNAGVAGASALSVCSGTTVNVSLSGADAGTGMTYQWLISANGINFNPIGGQTQSTFSFAATSPIYCACVLTCSGISDTSSAVGISINPFYTCYCSTNLGGNCATTAIDSVAFSSTTLVNGPTGCSAGNHIVYPASGNTTTTFITGQTYTITTKYNGNVRAVAWIDYDHSGSFDITEWTQLCTTSTAGTDVVATITIPSNATVGLTGLRIRSRASAGQNDSSTACATFGTGEAEDYLITIDSLSTGIVSHTAIDEIVVSPNPNQGVFVISGLKFQVAAVKVYNVLGECVQQLTPNASTSSATANQQLTINLLAQKKGIYFVQIQTEKETITKKVVLE